MVCSLVDRGIGVDHDHVSCIDELPFQEPADDIRGKVLASRGGIVSAFACIYLIPYLIELPGKVLLLDAKSPCDLRETPCYDIEHLAAGLAFAYQVIALIKQISDLIIILIPLSRSGNDSDLPPLVCRENRLDLTDLISVSNAASAEFAYYHKHPPACILLGKAGESKPTRG